MVAVVSIPTVHTHYCAMRTKWEQRVNGKVHRLKPLAVFVQRLCAPASHGSLGEAPLAALGKSGTSHSASRRELVSMSYRDQAIFPWRTGHGRTRQPPSRIL